MANVDLSSGINVVGQYPLDAKRYFKTIYELSNLGESNINAFNYYDNMIVICAEDGLQYIWREKVGNENGVLGVSYVYPVGSIGDGINYSGKSYNFFKFVNVDYSKLIIKIDRFTVNKRDKTNYKSIEVGDLIEGEYPYNSGRFIKAKVLQLPYTIEENLGIYFDAEI